MKRGVSLAVASMALACGNAQSTQCSCPDPTVEIDLPPDRAAAFTGAQLSGVACPGVTPACAEPQGTACARLTFRALAAGACQVELLFSAGYPGYQASLTFVKDACCQGYYADPPGSSKLQVPSATADAGGQG